jgi:hypothetical protein
MARPLACRLGVHRWQRLRRPDATWYRICRRCGVDGDAATPVFVLLVSSLAVVAGLLVVLVLQWLLGAFLIIGGVGGLGLAVLPEGLERLGGFLAAGLRRRN